MPLNKNLIILFSRAPNLGQVKHRLAQEGGENLALAVHKKLFSKSLGIIKQTGLEFKIYLSEKPATNVNYKYSLQNGSDLGERMSYALKTELQKYNKVCLIGSDCIDLTEDDLRNAVDQLEHGDLVIGPARDGGYYLVGLKRFIPELFTNINWGRSTVKEETLAIADRLKLKTRLLSMRSDIDYFSDLPANWKDL